MSRNLLHKNKLEDFKAWLDKKGIKHRPGKGAFQVLQVNNVKNYWNAVYERIEMPEHLTVVCHLEGLVRAFIKESKSESHKAA